MSLRITEIRYTRLMIHCNYCARRLCPHGWFKTAVMVATSACAASA